MCRRRNTDFVQTSRQKIVPAARLTNRNRRITQAESEIRRILAGHEPKLNDEDDAPSRRNATTAVASTGRRDTPFVKGDKRPSRVSFMDSEDVALRRDTPYVRNNINEEETEKISPKMVPRVSFAPRNIEETSIKLEKRRNTPFHNQDGVNGRPSS